MNEYQYILLDDLTGDVQKKAFIVTAPGFDTLQSNKFPIFNSTPIRRDRHSIPEYYIVDPAIPRAKLDLTPRKYWNLLIRQLENLVPPMVMIGTIIESWEQRREINNSGHTTTYNYAEKAILYEALSVRVIAAANRISRDNA